MVADRIVTEFRFILSQTGSSLENLNVNLHGHGRIIIKKALGPLKSLVLKKAQDAMIESSKNLWNGVSVPLQKSFVARLAVPL